MYTLSQLSDIASHYDEGGCGCAITTPYRTCTALLFFGNLYHGRWQPSGGGRIGLSRCCAPLQHGVRFGTAHLQQPGLVGVGLPTGYVFTTKRLALFGGCGGLHHIQAKHSFRPQWRGHRVPAPKCPIGPRPMGSVGPRPLADGAPWWPWRGGIWKSVSVSRD